MSRQELTGRLLVVAVEYFGADLPRGAGGLRRPILEHAYDVHTGIMPAHLRNAPRVAFTDPGRGWPSAPHLARCGACTSAATELIRTVIAELVEAAGQRMTGRVGAPSSDRLWLYPAIVA